MAFAPTTCTASFYVLEVEERVRGSYDIFSVDGVVEILNLQPRHGGLAEPYQIRQARGVIVQHKLAEDASP